MYLVFIDLSNASLHALAYVAKMAEQTGQEIILFHQVDIDDSLEGEIDVYIERKRLNEARKELERVSHFANPKQNLRFHFEVHDEISEVELKKLILKKGVDLAIGGISPGPGVKKWLFGSRSADYIALSLSDFLVVPERCSLAAPDKILCLFSGNGYADKVYEKLSSNHLVKDNTRIQAVQITKGSQQPVSVIQHDAFNIQSILAKDLYSSINSTIADIQPDLICIVAGDTNCNGCFENSLVQRLSLSVKVPLLVIMT